MGIKIENYRGFDIEFETYNETFTCVVSAEKRFEKESYSSIKKAIDEFKSKNADFKPFKVMTAPNEQYGGIGSGIYEVIGIRKDGRFVYIDSKGEKKQISEYNEKGVILYEPSFEPILVEIAYLETLVDEARENVKKAKQKIKGTKLTEIKSKFI